MAAKLIWFFAVIIGIQLVIRLILPLDQNIKYSTFYMWITWISFIGAVISYLVHEKSKRKVK